MPLPPALAAKLAKRGILKGQDGEKQEHELNKAQEEIIAEDYDDKPHLMETTESAPDQVERFQGWFACPNKWNVYHECNNYCSEKWIEPVQINQKYTNCRTKLLLKYPLPAHWQEVLDAGMGRYYYWNTETDLVSWLPPGHPKCQVSRSSAELRKHMIIERNKRLREEDVRRDDGKGSEYESSDDENRKDADESSDTSMDSLDEDDSKERSRSRKDRNREKPRERRERERERRESDRGRDRDKNRKSKSRSDDTLDPMDPAAYSDCPRGNWASGLPQRNEARTGVDPTASGPLFQMRPYPNPGAVLRANAQAGGGIGPKKG